MLLNDTSNHSFICGLTRSGKSYFALHALLELPYGVCYFNVQGEAVPKGFLKVYTEDISVEQLIDMLKEGVKINLIFRDYLRGYRLTAGFVLNSLMDAGFTEEIPVYVGVDECHLLEGYAKEMAKVVSTAGLKKGVRCVWITQRPANCDKTLYTQALDHYIFFIPRSDAAYMQSKGIDYAECEKLWQEPQSRRYCYFNGYVLEGRPAI